MSDSLSIFTPTHNTKYLLELYESIRLQNYDEWVVFPNGNATVNDIPKKILDDPRTIIVSLDEPTSTNIGDLKRIACAACTGSILAEIDHDDLVTPGIIDKIKEAFEDPEVVFAYSDSAAFNNEDKSPRFYGNANSDTNEDTVYGWKYYDYWQDGVLYKVPITPDPIPAHVSVIHNAPDHIRAFRRSTYEEVGGYDASLSVCDDQDLMCRLYLKGTFRHIKECGYLYRVVSGQNTWLQRNELIQTMTIELQEKYIEQMAVYWAKNLGLRCLDLGGRFFSPEGYESVDLKDADVICNLEEKWPIEDNSVAVLRCYDIIEHLHDTIHFMKEASRVLVPGGYLFISVPSTDDGNGGTGRGAFQDPLHVKFFNINSFFYYTRENQARYIDTPVRFKSIILKNYYPSQWEIDNRIPYVKAFLVNLKDNFRPHGLIEI